jgi:CheY-like chemotaxis protein
MLSSIGKPETVAQFGPTHFVAFLTKPIKPAHLHKTLLQVVNHQRRQFQPAVQVASNTVNHKLDQTLPLRILLAEDHRVNQKIALLMLERLGYRADVAGNGLEVLEALRRQVYDVVLLDVQMPEMDGLEAARQIRQQWQPKCCPRLIAMTANAMQGDRETCLKAGMDDYISKPVRIEALGQALKTCQSLDSCPDPSQDSPETNSELSCGLPEAPATDHPPLNPAALEAFRKEMGDAADQTIAELIDCYLTEIPLSFQVIRIAIANRDAAELLRAAHSLKASSAFLGAMTLSELFQALETIAQPATLEQSAAIFARIECEYQRVEPALQQLKV